MNSEKSEIFSTVHKALENISTPVGIAFSGGLDSSVLLDVVAKCVARENVRAIHVCHNLRPKKELEAELDLVRRVCAERGLTLNVITIPRGSIKAFARKKKCGIEAAARRFRYYALKRVAKKFGLSAILLAHHHDDQIETMLMRLVHGGSISALAGMRPIRLLSVNPYITIIRPFLKIPRKDLVHYALSANLKWSEDSTNAESAYLRNRVRKTLMPILDEQFKYWRSAFTRYQTQIEDLDDMVRGRAREKRSEIERNIEGKPALDIEMLHEESYAVRIEILRQYIRRFSNARPMSNRGLRHLEARIIQGSKNIEASGNTFALETDLLVFKGSTRFSSSPEQRTLAGLKTIRRENIYYLKIDSIGEYSCGPFNVRVSRESLQKIAIKEVDEPEGREFAIPVEFPFVFRNARAGDSLKYGYGIKTVESFIKKEELPQALRGIVPILEDAAGIVAVLPSALGCEGDIRNAYREPSLGESVQIVYIFLSMKGDQFINV